MDFWMFMNAYSIHDESGKASGRKPFFIAWYELVLCLNIVILFYIK